ncbi:histidinol-phosphatase HisJ family protein [Crassaminicella profunda]|uniref:histidinol-phosphatase HisJ family protein n=1 Tax=Crassaminicella profunda TaxID=1286698 RepID=UPI001CA6F817|nr:histidinol-phosphatase HisJ family protein [Crassaminicella profunda]QZY57241.1 histidinol-phosphatase HisJ family protein [Crassaminicella profunda]
MYDYHVHSHFSTDCDVNMEEMIQKAISIGLKEICFTDHIDYDYQDSSINFEFDIPSYMAHINNLVEKYKKNIKILRGVEIGIQPHIVKKCDELVMKEKFDFIISSIHTADKKDIHVGDFFVGKTPKEAYTQYFNELLICTKSFKNFNVLGHMNLLKRYHHHVEIQDIKNYFDIIEEIFRTLIYTGKGIEVNTSGFRYGLGETVPCKELLSFYKSLGGEIITVGSDAHTPEQLACKFNDTYDLLREIGFKYITIFENRQHTFKKI